MFADADGLFDEFLDMFRPIAVDSLLNIVKNCVYSSSILYKMDAYHVMESSSTVSIKIDTNKCVIFVNPEYYRPFRTCDIPQMIYEELKKISDILVEEMEAEEIIDIMKYKPSEGMMEIVPTIRHDAIMFGGISS